MASDETGDALDVLTAQDRLVGDLLAAWRAETSTLAPRDAGEWPPMNAIHRLAGMGGDQLLGNLLGHDSPEATAARPRRYEALTDNIRAFPGAGQLLRKVHDCGIAVILATSAPADELAILRRVLDADDVIDGQTTADDIEASKPAPDVFATATQRFSVDPRQALAIGDSVWDIQGANAAGIACVAVESGGSSRSELSEAGALAVYRDVQVLLDQFLTSPLARLAP
jgi:HAD superfamily hydrolase (TIGR01509 family)